MLYEDQKTADILILLQFWSMILTQKLIINAALCLLIFPEVIGMSVTECSKLKRSLTNFLKKCRVLDIDNNFCHVCIRLVLMRYLQSLNIHCCFRIYGQLNLFYPKSAVVELGFSPHCVLHIELDKLVQRYLILAKIC